MTPSEILVLVFSLAKTLVLVTLKLAFFLLTATVGVVVLLAPVAAALYLGWRLRRRRRLKGAATAVLVLAFLLSSAMVSRAQLPVIDALALIEKTTQVALQQTINVVRQTQAELVYKMSLRMAQWVSLAEYYIHRDYMPEWRIHNWFTDDVLYAKQYNFALTYGDPTGEGYASVTVPRQDPSAVFSSGYTEEAQAIVRTYLAQLDLLDSAMVRDTHVAGQYRFGGRAEAEAIDAFQTMVTDDQDLEQSLAAKLDHVSAGKLLRLQNGQARGAMMTALQEQLTVEHILEREGDVAVNNMAVTLMIDQAGGEGARPSIVEHADDALRNWRIR